MSTPERLLSELSSNAAPGEASAAEADAVDASVPLASFPKGVEITAVDSYELAAIVGTYTPDATATNASIRRTHVRNANPLPNDTSSAEHSCRHRNDEPCTAYRVPPLHSGYLRYCTQIRCTLALAAQIGRPTGCVHARPIGHGRRTPSAHRVYCAERTTPRETDSEDRAIREESSSSHQRWELECCTPRWQAGPLKNPPV